MSKEDEKKRPVPPKPDEYIKAKAVASYSGKKEKRDD